MPLETLENGKSFLEQRTKINATIDEVNSITDGTISGDIPVTATGTTTPRTLGDRAADVVNVKDFGAVGDGVTDDTDAIDRALSYYESIIGSDRSSYGQIFSRSDTLSLYFPVGTYIYNGQGYRPTTQGARVLRVIGDGPAGSTVKITSDIWFYNPQANLPLYVEFSDIKMIGGRGSYFNEVTTQQPQHGHRFYNCVFIAYTSSAIGSLSQDDPRWVVEDCIFEGELTGTSVGVSLPRAAAEANITGCTFKTNKYHIVTNEESTRDFNIGPNNTFIDGSGINYREADIWVIPSPNNSNERLKILANRFSNEGLDPTKPNILFADRENTSDEIFNHLTSKSTGNVRGLSLLGNNFQSVGSPSTQPNAVGIIYSYTPNVSDLRYESVSAQWRPCVIEYDNSITEQEIDAGGGYTNSGVRDDRISANPLVEFSKPVGGGLFHLSHNGDVGGASNISQKLELDVNLIKRLTNNSNVNDWGLGGDVSATPINDSNGNATAATFVFSSGENAANLKVTQSANFGNFEKGRPVWIEMELKKSSSNPLDAIQLEITVGSGIVKFVTIPLTDYWRRFSIPVIVADQVVGLSGFALTMRPNDYWEASKTSVDIGRYSLYHANSPADFSITKAP